MLEVFLSIIYLIFTIHGVRYSLILNTLFFDDWLALNYRTEKLPQTNTNSYYKPSDD